MSRRVMWMEQPGTDGVVTDIPAYQLGGRALVRSADAIMPTGLIRQRRGWAYDGTTADVADNLVGIARAKFIIAAATRTTTCDDDGDMFIHNPSGSGTALLTGSVQYLPRCVYRDEVIWCAQDGLTPLRRYSGAATTGTASDLVGTYTDGEATITALSFSAQPDKGAYVRDPALALGETRIVGTTSSSVTLEDLRASATSARTITLSLTGRTAPVVSVYNAGTITQNGGTGVLTGFGTKWNTDIAPVVNEDASLTIDFDGGANPVSIGLITTVTSDTSLATTGKAQIVTKSKHHIARSCPFKDAAHHKGSLWGTGVAQHKSRVYVGPLGWNVAYPPGFDLPYALGASPSSDNPLDFLLDFYDVPAPNDADECVALIPSDNALVVPKRKDAWGLYGSYGGVDVAMLPNGEGAGCMDVRSAFSLSIGPVWAGPNGVFALIGGTVRNLTRGRIEREWQNLALDFDYGTSDYCTIAEKGGVLVVHLTTAAGTIQRTWHLYPYDDAGKLNPRWLDRVSNFAPRYMFSSRISGEEDRILAVQNIDQGRVIDYGPALDGSGIARDGDGASPALSIVTGSNLAREAGARVDENMLEVSIEANLVDSGGTGSTLGGSVASSQLLDSVATITTNFSSMASKTTDLPVPHVHDVGVKAGLHQITLTKTATQTTESLTEISRIGFTVRNSKRPL